MIRISLVFLLGISLIACGGGGGSAPAGNNLNTDTAPPPDVDANGLWEGTVSQDGVGSYELFGLLHEGQIIARSYSANVLLIGTYVIDEDNISGSARAYELGVEKLGTVNFNGVAVEQSQVMLTFTSTYGASGSVSIFYDPLYERGSSLATIAGSYTSGSETLDISPNGALAVSNTGDGCNIIGSIEIIDPSFNLYKATQTFSGCDNSDRNDVYEGFAVLTDDTGVNDWLIMHVESEGEKGYYIDYFRD